MTEEQLNALRSVEQKPAMIGPIGGPARTLLYGYNVDRLSWHVYQLDGWLHHAIYMGDNGRAEFHDCGDKLLASSLSPNKRLYPEACDFAFCRKLKLLGVHLSFTTYGQMGDISARRPFIGRVFL
ncbi:hypothetical protein ACQR1W_31635 [Bradyrhizobium sp. HKCCYLS1011]|uniref:hypothetical protein n=1 Tax=Bradyrhizobium sp. HKCCYLS1011 TaxID=3420733 RepID=UPI003EBE0AEC